MAQTSWVNQDGLKVRFGPKDVNEENGVPAQPATFGQLQQVTYRIIGTELLDTCTFADGTLDERGARIPGNAFIKSATLDVDEAFAGTNAVLDIGFYKVDGSQATGGGDDGIDAAIAVTAIDAVGDEIACDGADIGTLLANTAPTGRTDTSVLIGASYDTAAFTAGKATLRVEYYVPVG